jgi:CPA1 family monovalent cation:H+ antiporter
VSAVLACVAGGLYVQQNLSIAVGPAARLQIRTVWDLAVFLLNAMVFLLLGAQFGTLIGDLRGSTLMSVVRVGVIITLVAIVVRMLWVPLISVLARLTRDRRNHRRSDPRAIFLVSWTSMRGVVSLATALGLPLVRNDGSPFPYRNEIILVTMVTIVITLFLQGLSLEPIIRRLKFEPEREHRDEEKLARREATRRGAEALEDLARESWADPRDVEALRREVRERARISDNHLGSPASRRRLRLGMIAAERRMLIRLRDEGAISDEVLRNLEQELDRESIRVGAGELDRSPLPSA